MNWKAVRRHNAIRSQRKARREQQDAARQARIDAAGGPVKLDELKAAARRVEPHHNHVPERDVWIFRDKEWEIYPVAYFDGKYFAYPHRSYRAIDEREFIPLTAAASKYVAALYAKESTNA